MKKASAILLVALATSPELARAEQALPKELEEISILEKPGAQVPLDAPLTNQDGQKLTLGDYLEGDKPLVLVLAYYHCPMLCNLVINGVADGLKQLAWSAGEKYRVLVVSFDPRDTLQLARDKRQLSLESYKREVPEKGFDFVVSDAASVKRIADAVGFRYKWDEAGQQYAHAAGAFVLTPKGALSRTLYGISFPADSLRMALLEASQGKLGGAWDQVVLFCFHYDPNARGYVLAATRLMRAGGAFTLLLLAAFFSRLWRKRPVPSNSAAAASHPLAAPTPSKRGA